MSQPEEFYANERWPNNQFPKTRWYHRLRCRLWGHSWRKFYWAWINTLGDLNVCWGCYKCQGPVPLEREIPEWPSYLNPY